MVVPSMVAAVERKLTCKGCGGRRNPRGVPWWHPRRSLYAMLSDSYSVLGMLVLLGMLVPATGTECWVCRYQHLVLTREGCGRGRQRRGSRR